EFYRMCDEFGWDKEDKEREQASRDFKDALVQQFNDIYGTDVNDLTSWRTLCQIVHVSPIPDTLESCREAVKATHVNIVDLVDTETTGEPVTVFVSEVDLSKYTISMGKFFPRDNAYAGGLLRYLLRRIINPRQERRSQTQTQTPLDNFFAKYPEFKYNSSVSASLEFYRMCDKFGWDKENEDEDENKKRKKASRGFKNALVQQFNDIYGTDVKNLVSWRTLCQIVHVSPIPDTLESCREAVKATHVNIVDLVDTETTGEPVTVFSSEVDLSKYTKLMGKFFPRDNAYAGGLLRYLLRHILNPRQERVLGSSRKTQSRRRFH
ncbi:hypothetical protein DFJ58DRAFT_670416, partial [Suillus subalutaceus]|uniref:uncharacterized protein n=1 Tax=Suillus subalutaceus TaxID=48586 RepID=UPI001B881610